MVIKEGMANDDDMDKRDFEWLLDKAEFIEVWRDVNDLDARPPIVDKPGFAGHDTVRIRGL